MLFARCRTCLLWFNTGIDEGEKLRFNESSKLKLSCPLGHSHDYEINELREKVRFEKKVRRVAGRPIE